MNCARSRSRSQSRALVVWQPEFEPEGPDPVPEEPIRPTWVEVPCMWQEDLIEAHRAPELWNERPQPFTGHEHIIGCGSKARDNVCRR